MITCNFTQPSFSIFTHVCIPQYNSDKVKQPCAKERYVSETTSIARMTLFCVNAPTSDLRPPGSAVTLERKSPAHAIRLKASASGHLRRRKEGEGTKPYCLVMDQFWPSRIGNWILLSICRETEAANRLPTLIRSSYRINDFDFLGVDSALAFSQTRRESIPPSFISPLRIRSRPRRLQGWRQSERKFFHARGDTFLISVSLSHSDTDAADNKCWVSRYRCVVRTKEQKKRCTSQELFV